MRDEAFDLFFLAMAHQQLGHRHEARGCYDQAVRWLEAQKSVPDSDAQGLAAFRAEAESVLASPPEDLPADVFARHRKSRGRSDEPNVETAHAQGFRATFRQVRAHRAPGIWLAAHFILARGGHRVEGDGWYNGHKARALLLPANHRWMTISRNHER